MLLIKALDIYICDPLLDRVVCINAAKGCYYRLLLYLCTLFLIVLILNFLLLGSVMRFL